MKIQRRTFLRGAVAGAAGGLLAPRPVHAADADNNPIALVPLGKELTVSRVGFGTGMKAFNRTSNHIKLGRKHFDRLFHYAYDLGIRLFDMADLYGSHEYAARNLAGKPRDSYTLVSKIWWRDGGVPDEDKGDADVLVKRFLRELKTDYIDLVQLHCMTSPKWPKEHRKQMDLLEDLKQKGLIRAHGCSCHALGALEAAAAEPWVDVVHTRINPFGLLMDDKPERVLPAVKNIHAAGKGVIGMKIIGEGNLRDDDRRREQSFQYALNSHAVDAIIIGFEQTWEMNDALARTRRALAVRTLAAG
ncbi:MAG: aldo/keto reductase [Pirellulales bacterium]|nr:aldo/keto reductase [Pirellulales bacterium]